MLNEAMLNKTMLNNTMLNNTRLNNTMVGTMADPGHLGWSNFFRGDLFRDNFFRGVILWVRFSSLKYMINILHF